MKATYTPLENGDPISTVVAGILFKAGQPVDIAGVQVESLKVEQSENEKGEIVNRSKACRVTLASILEKNPYFSIDGKPAPAKAALGRPRTPKTPEEYRAYAIRWFTGAESTVALSDRWKAEAVMREKLGVHDDGEDVAYLRPFYEGRFHELQQAEAAGLKPGKAA